MDTFSVIVEGRCLDGFDATTVRTALAQLMKISDERAAALLAGRDVRVKSGVDAATGDRYLVALRAAGVACRLDSERLDFDAPIQSAAAPAAAFAQPAAVSAQAGPAVRGGSKLATALAQLLGGGLVLVVSGYFFWNAASAFMGKGSGNALGSLFSGDGQAKQVADQIIKGELKAPGSFRTVRQDVLWSKKMAGETAYVVRTEYDAQNGFGALLRGCQYTSFITEGEQFRFDRLSGMQPCADERDRPDWEQQKQRLVPILLQNAGLERFANAEPATKSAPVANGNTPSPATAPAPAGVPPAPAASAAAPQPSPPSGSALAAALAYARGVASKDGCILHEDAIEAISGNLAGIEGPVVIAAYTLEGCGGGNNWGQQMVVLQAQQGVTRKLAGIGGPSFEALKVVDGRLVAVASGYGPNDPRCCPTLKGPVTYVLRGDALVATSQPGVAASPAPSVSALPPGPGRRATDAGAVIPSAQGGRPNLAAEMLPRYGASPNWPTCNRLNDFHISDSGNGMTAQAWEKCITVNSDRANRGSLQVMCAATQPRPKACAG